MVLLNERAFYHILALLIDVVLGEELATVETNEAHTDVVKDVQGQMVLPCGPSCIFCTDLTSSKSE